MSLTIPIILGTVREGRQGLRAARFLMRRLTEAGHEAPLVDPAELQLPLLQRMYKEYPAGEAPEPLERLAQLYRRADAFVVVSAEYNHSIPPALSNTLDHFLEEYFWRPSGIVCYSAGRYGGVRAAMQLRAMLGELGTPSIPSLLPIRRSDKRSTKRATRVIRASTGPRRGSSLNLSGMRRPCVGNGSTGPLIEEGSAMPRLSTHVLDTARGCPAAGVSLVLSRFEDGRHRTVLYETKTNQDGRTDTPLLEGDGFKVGQYEIAFHVGAYFREQGLTLPEPLFLDIVPLRFGIADPSGHYHVPLLVSPWSYSTYRGS